MFILKELWRLLMFSYMSALNSLPTLQMFCVDALDEVL
ncbi:hypothetical protein THTE_2004 [Thermogutta terrifontis]|uniref:Uncharacterized protein n=1 Tax=Thermogutta terrifontis TaxID=1331910 RepID=A0A286RF71_9BACT|nr:hypothetical protein THTE_2004 [Thermogutta terrifontis]